MDLMKYIPVGRQNAVTAKKLAARTGKSVRTVMKEIHRLRAAGKLIVSTTERPHGYFIPRSDDQKAVRHFVNTMYSRIKRIEEATRPAIEFLKNRSL